MVTDASDDKPDGFPEDLSEYPNLQTLLDRTAVSQHVQASRGYEDFIGLPFVTVDYPKGRDTQRFSYYEEDAERLLKQPWETARFLGQTGALYRTDEGSVEVDLRLNGPGRIRDIPGARKVIEDVRFRGNSTRKRTAFKVSVSKRSHRLEISPASALFRAVTTIPPRFFADYTLKVQLPKSAFSAGSDALETKFRRLAMALFFDLDVRYGLSVDFVPPPFPRTESSRSAVAEKVRFPPSSYAPQAISLYQYGRWAGNLPLLAFLAYYQVLEFYFPIFSQAEALSRTRQALSNPRFTLASDSSVLEVLRAAREATGAFIGEKDQLASTIRHSSTTEQLLDFLQTVEDPDHFTKRGKALPGISPLKLGEADTLHAQVAERVYNIRCRVVHTKSDGGSGAVELLLPDSPEVRQMSAEIELVRFLAERALIAGAEPLDLN